MGFADNGVHWGHRKGLAKLLPSTEGGTHLEDALQKGLETTADPGLLNAMHLQQNPELRLQATGVPIVITTVFFHTARLRATLQYLPKVDSIGSAPLFFAIEGVSGEMLSMIASQLSYAHARLYFVPVDQCYRTRPSRNDKNDLDFKINLSFLWIMHLVMVTLRHKYVVVLEDDMVPGPDFYAHHLSLSRVEWSRYPDVVAVMATAAGEYVDCYGPLRQQLLGNFSEGIEGELFLANEVMPWGAGYLRPIVLELLQWYVGHELTGKYHRYDIIMNRLLTTERGSIFPVAWRIHGDPKHYFAPRRQLPEVRMCNRTEYRIVWPRERAGPIVFSRAQ